jgi:hypothetical protein
MYVGMGAGVGAFLGAALRAAAFFADFFGAAFFAFLRAGAAFFALDFFALDFAFFAFFAFFAIMDSRRCSSDFLTVSTRCTYIVAAVSRSAAATFFPASACGTAPPVAQSINSTLCTTGITVPAAI